MMHKDIRLIASLRRNYDFRGNASTLGFGFIAPPNLVSLSGTYHSCIPRPWISGVHHVCICMEKAARRSPHGYALLVGKRRLTTGAAGKESEPTPKTNPVRFEAVLLKPDGTFEETSRSMVELRISTGAPLRDLLQLGLDQAISNEDCDGQVDDESQMAGRGEPRLIPYTYSSRLPPRILPRRFALLLTLGHLRCIIYKDGALFFDPNQLEVRCSIERIASTLSSSSSSLYSSFSCLVSSMDPLSCTEGERLRWAAVTNSRPDYTQQQQQEPQAFELAVVESVLAEVTAAYARRVSLLLPVVESQLDWLATSSHQPSNKSWTWLAWGTKEAEDAGPNIRRDSADLQKDEGVIERLIPIRNGLNNIEYATQALLNCFSDILSNDEDMNAMMLTAIANNTDKPSAWPVSNSTQQQYKHREGEAIEDQERGGEESIHPPQHEVVELLFESFHREINQVHQQLVRIQSRVKATEQLVSIAVDLRRNRIMHYQLTLAMATIGLGTSSACFSMFGMNLVSGFETSQGAFAVVTICGLLSGAIAVRSSSSAKAYYAASHSTERHRAADMHALTRLFEDIGTIESLLLRPGPNKLGAAPRAADKEELKVRLAAATGRVVSDREMDLIFNIFDMNKDGHIEKGEVSAIYKRARAVCNEGTIFYD
eukprot:gb/GEZN01002550.1/.p1 GENE.gb/GEZN01002550.1/~~gb/GEZN01002550.1/.p1  ORF type:complete len:655 (+),score=85.84 gb/GEZN01002550.1/:303-2267(+)